MSCRSSGGRAFHTLGSAVSVSVLCCQDVKMKRLAARHVTSTTSVHSRQAVHRQLRQWDSNLHRLRLSHYRYACYVASLHNVELPNSLVLHSHRSRFEFVTLNLIQKNRSKSCDALKFLMLISLSDSVSSVCSAEITFPEFHV